ncbi:MAG: PEP-CTERM sorting domain-containing protein [Verrucomicrobiales bacterium]
MQALGHKVLHCFGALFFLTAPLHAVTVTWGNDTPAAMQDSSLANMDSTFKFELGAFATGFTAGSAAGTPVADPSALSVASLLSSWKPLDIATVGNGWDTGTRILSRGSSPVINLVQQPVPNDTIGESDQTTNWFATGEQVYIWAHNGTSSPADATEWALFTTDDAVVPAFGVHDFNFDVDPEINPQTPLYGTLLPNGGIQTEFVGAPIPEPGTASLLVISALAAALRRKRES